MIDSRIVFLALALVAFQSWPCFLSATEEESIGDPGCPVRFGRVYRNEGATILEVLPSDLPETIEILDQPDGAAIFRAESEDPTAVYGTFFLEPPVATKTSFFPRSGLSAATWVTVTSNIGLVEQIPAGIYRLKLQYIGRHENGSKIKVCLAISPTFVEDEESLYTFH